MATPTMIPVHGDTKTHSGPLGTQQVVRPRSTEIAALYPKRGGVYDAKAKDSWTWTPPVYFDECGEKHYKVWCPCCDKWQRRDAFYTNVARTTGLQAYCKTCDNDKRNQRRVRARLQTAA